MKDSLKMVMPNALKGGWWKMEGWEIAHWEWLMWTGLERNDNFLGNRTEQSDSLCVQAGTCAEGEGGGEFEKARAAVI